MLSDYDPVPTLAVADLQRARDFYEGVLGFPLQSDLSEGVTYNSGSGSLFIYTSAYAGTNKATYVSFHMSEEAFDAEVADLRGKGVSFLTFEADGITWEEGVASFGDQNLAVWFEDPDGNILNLETLATS